MQVQEWQKHAVGWACQALTAAGATLYAVPEGWDIEHADGSWTCANSVAELCEAARATQVRLAPLVPISTWDHSERGRISGAYSEDDHLVHVHNSAGESWTETLSSWLDRLEAIRKDGWWQVA